MIREIVILLKKFITLAKSGEISLSGLAAPDSRSDEKFITTLLDSFGNLIDKNSSPAKIDEKQKNKKKKKSNKKMI